MIIPSEAEKYKNLLTSDNQKITQKCNVIGEYKPRVWAGATANKARMYYVDYQNKYKNLMRKMASITLLTNCIVSYNDYAVKKQQIDQKLAAKYAEATGINVLTRRSATSRAIRNSASEEIRRLNSELRVIKNNLNSLERRIKGIVG